MIRKTTINWKDTLLSMAQGESAEFASKHEQSIRKTATRLKKEGCLFQVTVSGRTNVKVTRLN